MILLLLIQVDLLIAINTVRIRSQDSQTLQALFSDVSFNSIHNKQNIFTLNITQAYDIELIDEQGKVIETPYISLDNLDLDNFIIENQCVGFPRHPQLTELMDYQILNKTHDTVFSDIITATDYNNLYIITQDLIIIQFKLNTKYWVVSQQRKQIDLKNYIEDKNQKIKTKAFFSCPKGHLNCLVISQYGGIWIPKFIDFDDTATEIVPELDNNFLKRKEIKKISTFESILAVAAGEDGVDIYRCGYKISSNYDKKIYYLNTINNILMEVPITKSIYIIGVKIQDNFLYILDEDLGVFIFNITNTQKISLIMKISIPRTIAFDFYENTLMVVAETVNHIQFIVEIFLDFQSNTYYVNRVYVDDFTFVDIQMTKEYAFFIAEDTHMIIKHSIFNGFVKNNKELVRTFVEDQLIKFQHYSSIIEEKSRYSESIFYVGFSKQSLHAWKFRNYNAFIVCNFDSRTEKKYTLKLNSSSCYENQSEYRYSQCQMIQNFTVFSDGTIIESDSLVVIITVSSISSIILLILIVFLFTKWRKIVNSIKKKAESLKEAKTYGRFQEQGQNA